MPVISGDPTMPGRHTNTSRPPTRSKWSVAVLLLKLPKAVLARASIDTLAGRKSVSYRIISSTRGQSDGLGLRDEFYRLMVPSPE